MADSDFKITQKQAADFLNVSTKTISRYRKKGLPYKMILNPVTGKQEVRFRQVDLDRWLEGRQLLATFGQEGKSSAAADKQTAGTTTVTTLPEPPGEYGRENDYLSELLAVYKDQIEVLREQLEDMREQLSRRDRQIDDLMRLMVGLQLEYKPEKTGNENEQESVVEKMQSEQIPKKKFSRSELSESILRLRQRGKGYGAIAKGLNQINVATLSGKPYWTEAEVQSLLPSLVDKDQRIIEL